MGLFYTGKGDKGISSVGKRKILVKDSVISEALGALDELNSLVGLIRHQKVSEEFIPLLEEIQENLFIVQAQVASALFSIPGEPALVSNRNLEVPVFSEERIKKLERVIDEFEKEVKPARSFVLPGASEGAAWLDFTRTVVRRVERAVVAFSKKYSLATEPLAYMNRLSSLFFAMARVEVKRREIREKYPHY